MIILINIYASFNSGTDIEGMLLQTNAAIKKTVVQTESLQTPQTHKESTATPQTHNELTPTPQTLKETTPPKAVPKQTVQYASLAVGGKLQVWRVCF